MSGLQLSRAHNSGLTKDPVTTELDFGYLPASMYMFQNWTQADIYDMSIQQQDLKDDLVDKERGLINISRFQAHCQMVPLELREWYDIDSLASTRRQQRQELSRIDKVIEDALCFWALVECD